MYPAALTLILVAIILGIGLTVLGQYAISTRTATSIVDETFTSDNRSCVALANTHITASTATFENATDGTTYDGSCFEWDSTLAYRGSCVTLLPSAACLAINGSVNTSYTYGASNNWQTAVDDSVTNLDDFVPWFTVLIVIIAAAIIIGVMIRRFATGR